MKKVNKSDYRKQLSVEKKDPEMHHEVLARYIQSGFEAINGEWFESREAYVGQVEFWADHLRSFTNGEQLLYPALITKIQKECGDFNPVRAHEVLKYAMAVARWEMSLASDYLCAREDYSYNEYEGMPEVTTKEEAQKVADLRSASVMQSHFFDDGVAVMTLADTSHRKDDMTDRLRIYRESDLFRVIDHPVTERIVIECLNFEEGYKAHCEEVRGWFPKVSLETRYEEAKARGGNAVGEFLMLIGQEILAEDQTDEERLALTTELARLTSSRMEAN